MKVNVKERLGMEEKIQERRPRKENVMDAQMSSDSHCFSCDTEISTKKGREKLELLTKSIDQKTVLLDLWKDVVQVMTFLLWTVAEKVCKLLGTEQCQIIQRGQAKFQM